MIKKFHSFLNEAARTKFPEYKVGDLVIIDKYHEFQQKHKIEGKWETYSKLATTSDLGMIGEIAAIDTEKKEYVVKFVNGLLRNVYRGRSSTASYTIPDGNHRSQAYLRVKQNQVTTEGLGEIQELLKNETYEPGEKVSVKLSGEKSVTRQVIGISIAKSIENKELTYFIEGVTGTVKSKLIEKELDVNDEHAIKFLAEEIANVLGTKIHEDKPSDFVYDVAKLEGKDLISGYLYFKDDAARDKFCTDLQKFIDTKLDKNFQKVMNNGESSDVKVKEMGPGTYSWYKGTISKNKIIQAARNLGINVKEFLEKKRGAIAGKKYGLR